MTRPLSIDLRERVVAAIQAGEICRSVAKRFEVAVSSVAKWSQRQRMTGSVAPGKMGGHRKPVLDPHRDFIVQRIEDVPHLTLHRLKDELVRISQKRDSSFANSRTAVSLNPGQFRGGLSVAWFPQLGLVSRFPQGSRGAWLFAFACSRLPG